jgi:hypothetical protein
MKLCLARTLALAFLLVLLAAVVQSQGIKSGTPIIVGDGSVHIRSEQAPFDSPGSAGRNWNMTNPKEYHLNAPGKTGQYGNIFLIGRTGSDWTSYKPIGQPLINLNAEAKDKCKVEVKFGDLPNQKTVTIHDEGNKKGVVIEASPNGLTGAYKPINGGIELVQDTSDQMTEIDIHISSSGQPKKFDTTFIQKNCPIKLYLGCGILVEHD